MAGRFRRPGLGAAIGWVASCSHPTTPLPQAEPLGRTALVRELEAFEAQRRDGTDFARLAPFDSGADPWAVVSDGQGGALGLLRGSDQLLWLDPQAGIHAVVPVVGQPIDTVLRGSEAFVVGEAAPSVQRWLVGPEGLAAAGSYDLPDTFALRAVEVAGGRILVADRHQSRLWSLDWPVGRGAPLGAPELLGACEGIVDVAAVQGLAVANCLLERGLWLIPLAGGPSDGVRITHDGPLWSVAVVPGRDPEGGWTVVAGGVEDHPLDRTGGSFGYIDSWLYVYDVKPCDPAGLCAERRAAINLGDHGIVTPKWVDAQAEGDELAVAVVGYGGSQWLDLRLDGQSKAVRDSSARPVPAGMRQVAYVSGGWLGADPLLDQWVVSDGDRVRLVAPAGKDPRPWQSRLGEVLFYTTALAPGATNEGRHSRFSCETCHFEGTVDGRVHYTGRGQVHATTKPLLGLFNNRPHFSRALDRSLGKMVDNEFAVANRTCDHGPDFDLDPAGTPWLAPLELPGVLGPEALRKAFMEYFMVASHGPNPVVHWRLVQAAAQGQTPKLTEIERQGAELFLHHCERCHQARTSTDDEATRVPFGAWEALILADNGPLVWARPERMRTGIEPYVHPEGARVTSLRRLWLKRPYFTDGSARDLDGVLRTVSVDTDFVHRTSGDGAQRTGMQASRAGLHRAGLHRAGLHRAGLHVGGLSEPQRKALRAFLGLL